MSKIILGIYRADNTPLGYKTDTFWNLSADKSDAKVHVLDENGDIPAHLVDNLDHIVTDRMGVFPLNVFYKATSKKLRTPQGIRILEGLRLGYEYEHGDKDPVFTHAIVDEGVQKLSP